MKITIKCAKDDGRNGEGRGRRSEMTRREGTKGSETIEKGRMRSSCEREGGREQ